jgi:hypothetical protein
MDLLEETYLVLESQNMVSGRDSFSRQYLNKSNSYWRMIKATNREISIDSLCHLASQIKSKSDILKNSRYGELRAKAAMLVNLNERIWAHLYHRCLRDAA